MFSGFYWATVCKTVRPMLSDRFVCLVCLVLSACDIGVLWPDGWMDQGKTWYGGRRRRRPHCVRWGPSSPPQKGAQPGHSPQFSSHVRCGQTAGWIKMPLGMETGLSQRHIVEPSSPQKGAQPKILAHVCCGQTTG